MVRTCLHENRALIFVLAREGIALDDVSLLRRVRFQADDPQDPLILIRYINIHRAETRHAASTQECRD